MIGGSEETLHWFLVPLILCGTLIGADAVAWVRGQLELLDARGIIGVLGYHFFFLAPLLHVAWDYWMGYVDPPRDWRAALGTMAWVNVVGLGVYKLSAALVIEWWLTRTGTTRTTRSSLAIDYRRFWPVLALGLLVSAAAQVAVYVRLGGISGYVELFENSPENFRGMGILFLVSESAPTLFMFGYAAWVARRQVLPSWITLAGVLVLFVILKLLFGGLRGSRSNTVWGLFWAVGIIHCFIRPFARHVLLGGVCALVGFMYVYGFYKSSGVEGLRAAMTDSAARQELSEQHGRRIETVVLGDLARADVQALLFYRMTDPRSDYEPAYGRTYVGALALFIPEKVWPDRPESKVREGTQALYGMGEYAPGIWASSRIYGLAGEAMLNFGPWAAPASYLVLGVAVAWLVSFRSRLRSGDSRWLLYPLLLNLCFAVLAFDLDNLIVIAMKNGVVPFAVVVASSRWVKAPVEAKR